VNRRQRRTAARTAGGRAALSYADQYTCPDCASDTELRRDDDGVSPGRAPRRHVSHLSAHTWWCVMLYALDTLDRLVTATPGAVGRCRGCGAALTPKCGPLVAHHWAHRSGDCDRWAEPDSAWHLAWQACAPADRTEVPIGNHRADIITPDGRVVEVQHSHLPVADIAAREAHYGRMAWLWDAREAYEAERLTLNPRATWTGFRWKHPRKSIASCRRPVFLDLDGVRLLRVRKFHQSERFAGWGTVASADDFRRWLGQPSTVERTAA